MANLKQVKSEALATVDAAISILNRYPDLGEANTELSFNLSANPFTFLMDLFKSTAGYNKVIEILGRFISSGLPVVEATVKGLLITKLKDMISCSVNPFFTEDILRNGIVFNVEEIDIADVLKYSPLDSKVGKYFYFGAEDAKMPDDLIHSDDMDAFIWFVINKANRRYVWKPKKNRQDDEWREDYPTDGTTKLKKEDGIVTLEYNEYPLNISDAYGGEYRLQTPYNNCLHVFIGDVRENKSQIVTLTQHEKNLYQEEENIKLFSNKIENKEFKIELLREEKRILGQKFENSEIEEKDFKKEYKKINNKIQTLQTDINDLLRRRTQAYEAKRRFQFEIGNIQKQVGWYFPFVDPNRNRNYYYGKTLIEFNIDYIMSLTLFEEKSLTAKLIDAITAVLTVDLKLTYKQQLIKNEVKKMVSMITESDDLVVSDCFFTFSNDDYDAMSRQTELRKAGLLTINGDETSAVKINADKILQSLNEISAAADKQTIQSTIEGTIINLTKELSDTTYEMTDNVRFGVQMNIIENLLNSLCYVLVCSVLSPKVYLLLLINLRIIGRETNFDLKGFIGQYRQLIAEIIRSIRDQLLDYLLKEIMIIIGDLVKELTIKLSVEQARYYTRLIKKLIECFRKHGSGLDFDIDNVDYSDILPSEEEEPKDNEC